MGSMYWLAARSEDVMFYEDMPKSLPNWVKVMDGVAGLNAGFFDGQGRGLGALVINSKVIRQAENRPILVRRGDKVTVENASWFDPKWLFTINWAIGGFPFIVENGEVRPYDKVRANVGGLQVDILRQRSAVGIRGDGSVVIAAWTSATVDQVAKDMISIGCINAMCVDGGGSTALHVEGKDIIKSSRLIPNAIVFKKILDYGNIGKLVAPSNPSQGKRIKICIDPGHQTNIGDVGARGNGIKEEELTLTVSNYLRDELSKYDVDIVMTRSTAVTSWNTLSQSLSGRVQIAENNKADLFVSIHANAFSSSTASGVETLIYKKGGRAEQTAKPIQENIVALGMVDRKVKEFPQLHVLKYTTMPAVLVELGFMTNPSDAQKLKDPKWQRNVAKAIAEGIASAWGLSLAKQEIKETEPDYIFWVTKVDGLWKVQAGAYSVKENADRLALNLKNDLEKNSGITVRTIGLG